MQVFLMTFLALTFKQKERRHPELAGGRMGRKRERFMAGIKLTTWASFSGSIHGILLYLFKVSAVEKQPSDCRVHLITIDCFHGAKMNPLWPQYVL